MGHKADRSLLLTAVPRCPRVHASIQMSFISTLDEAAHLCRFSRRTLLHGVFCPRRFCYLWQHFHILCNALSFSLACVLCNLSIFRLRLEATGCRFEVLSTPTHRSAAWRMALSSTPPMLEMSSATPGNQKHTGKSAMNREVKRQ